MNRAVGMLAITLLVGFLVGVVFPPLFGAGLILVVVGVVGWAYAGCRNKSPEEGTLPFDQGDGRNPYAP